MSKTEISAKHTPGPWDFEDDAWGQSVTAEGRTGEGWIICDMGLPCDLVGMNDDNLAQHILDERLANGALVAAAPDLATDGQCLIERLDEFWNELEDGEEFVRFNGHVLPALARFKVAIARAAGQSVK